MISLEITKILFTKFKNWTRLVPRPHIGTVKAEGAWYLFLCDHDVKTSTKREHVVHPTIICSTHFILTLFQLTVISYSLLHADASSSRSTAQEQMVVLWAAGQDNTRLPAYLSQTHMQSESFYHHSTFGIAKYKKDTSHFPEWGSLGTRLVKEICVLSYLEYITLFCSNFQISWVGRIIQH